MLQIRHLSIGYDGHAVLHDLSLHVGRGQVVCVGGGSGSGKSSLLNAVLGFVPSEGEILVDGIRQSATSIGAIRRRIAYVPQELALPHETVEEMVRLPFTLKANRSIPFSEERLLAEWGRLGLEPELLRKRSSQISGGQRQRVMLSVAGLLGKRLLLADEPTSALDNDTARLVLDYFRMLAAERGMAVLVVSHSPVFLALPDTIILKERK